MNNVFISYVRENSGEVDKIYEELKSRGVNVWLDKHDIYPGQRWKDVIRKAIGNGSYFVACFSSAYFQKDKTYMNEELVLAIEELRLRPSDRTWFIPLRLDECKIPDRAIGAGETLSDIQFVDMYENWNKGIEKLIKTINPNEISFNQLFQNAKSAFQQEFSSRTNFRLSSIKGRKSKVFTIGLIGNTGVGKTMLAKSLGAGEYFSEPHPIPITGDKVREYKWINDCQIVDIPLSYGFSESENHEMIDYIKNNVDLIVKIIHVNSAFRIYRDDYALLNLLNEFDIPLIIVLNQIDLIEEKDIKELLENLAEFLKAPVLPVSAYKGTNVSKLKELLLDIVEILRAKSKK